MKPPPVGYLSEMTPETNISAKRLIVLQRQVALDSLRHGVDQEKTLTMELKILLLNFSSTENSENSTFVRKNFISKLFIRQKTVYIKRTLKKKLFRSKFLFQHRKISSNCWFNQNLNLQPLAFRSLFYSIFID